MNCIKCNGNNSQSFNIYYEDGVILREIENIYIILCKDCNHKEISNQIDISDKDLHKSNLDLCRSN